MAIQVSLFLCPSDGAPPPADGTGPTNYAFCSGDGSNGGDATNANGTFILGPAQSVANVRDGTSQTAAASEQLLGIAGPYSQTTPDTGARALDSGHGPCRRGPVNRRRLRHGQRRLAAQQGFFMVGRQLSERPVQPLPDPERRPARLHRLSQPRLESRAELSPGGVNLLYCDGHVAFTKDSVNLGVWRAVSTRAGGEVISADSL